MTPLVESWAPTPGHLNAVMLLMEASFPARWGERWTRAQLAGLLASGAGAWLAVVRDGGPPAGFALTRVVADEAELMLLGVGPEHRRRGLASALLNGVSLTAAGTGARSLFAEVRQGNAAEGFYRSRGFVVVGRRANYYRSTEGETHDAMTMRRTLE